jgi:hypothetical protein
MGAASDSDRGNWATLAAVPAQDQYLFEIWKPGDSLTAFYVKIQYGTSQLVLWKAKSCISSATVAGMMTLNTAARSR